MHNQSALKIYASKNADKDSVFSLLSKQLDRVIKATVDGFYYLLLQFLIKKYYLCKKMYHGTGT